MCYSPLPLFFCRESKVCVRVCVRGNTGKWSLLLYKKLSDNGRERTQEKGQRAFEATPARRDIPRPTTKGYLGMASEIYSCVLFASLPSQREIGGKNKSTQVCRVAYFKDAAATVRTKGKTASGAIPWLSAFLFFFLMRRGDDSSGGPLPKSVYQEVTLRRTRNSSEILKRGMRGTTHLAG